MDFEVLKLKGFTISSGTTSGADARSKFTLPLPDWTPLMISHVNARDRPRCILCKNRLARRHVFSILNAIQYTEIYSVFAADVKAQSIAVSGQTDPGNRTQEGPSNRCGMEETQIRMVPAVDRATRILDHVARARSGQTLSDLARDLSLPKSTAHMLCQTLVELNLLIRNADQTYRLGPHLMRWSNAFARQSDVAAEFASIWDKETELPGATITLTVLEGTEVVYIAARNSAVSHSLVDFRAGMRLPAAFTATGKAFLSHMNDFEVERMYSEGLPEPRTKHSVRSLDELLGELAAIRTQGFSVDNQQVAEGIVCFGASVLDSHNRPIAGVAVSLLAGEVAAESRKRVIDNVKRIASRLSLRMGADLD
jgi:DNA-binding IclR family transcriptional regulator